MLGPPISGETLMDMDVETTAALVRRLELQPTLIKRLEEEAITSLVPLPEAWVSKRIQGAVERPDSGGFLSERGWSQEDFHLHACRPEALRRFAEQRFGPGLEEQFLAARGAHDQIIYSLLRARDPALLRELWIRIEEGETTFAEAAQVYGEGPESERKGLIGPVSIGQLAPRSWLSCCEVSSPAPFLLPVRWANGTCCSVLSSSRQHALMRRCEVHVEFESQCFPPFASSEAPQG